MKPHAYQGNTSDSEGPAIRLHRWITLAAGLIFAVAFNLPGPAAGAASPSKSAPAVAPAERGAPKQATGKTKLARSAEERLGVKIRGVRLSAAGYMLDLRYRVVDAAKAEPLLDRKTKPYLLDQSGARFGVPFSPKVGALRSTRRGEIHLDRDYSMLFGNPGRYLQQGSKITLVVGETKIENLTVD